jgi:hypothetical protein
MISNNLDQDKQNNLDSSLLKIIEDVTSGLFLEIEPAEFCYFCGDLADADGAISINGDEEKFVLINGQKICYYCAFYELPKHVFMSIPGFELLSCETIDYWLKILSESVRIASAIRNRENQDKSHPNNTEGTEKS